MNTTMSCTALQRLWANIWILEQFAGRQGMRGVEDKVHHEMSLHDLFQLISLPSFSLFNVQFTY